MGGVNGEMTRDAAREAWTASGLTYGDLTLGTVQKLLKLVDTEMKASGLIKGTFRMMGGPRVSLAPRGFHVEMKCKSFYFQKREAITFNDNGFIGFAGWADKENIQPILRGFVTWVAWMKAERRIKAG